MLASVIHTMVEKKPIEHSENSKEEDLTYRKE